MQRFVVMKPEGDWEEEHGGECPDPGGEKGSEPRGETRAVGRHDDAPVTVHGDEGKRPQQHEPAHELKHNKHAVGSVNV